jgi:hypothetical protein
VFNNQQERRGKEETTTSLDIDTDDASFCDSEGHYRPELEEEHDRRQRAELRESEIENDFSKSPPRNDGTVLTRSPCALGEGWVRYRCVDGISDDDKDKHKRAEATKGKHGKEEASSPYSKAKKKFEQEASIERSKTKFHAKAETTTHEKAEATKKKKQRANRKVAEEEGMTTAHETGTRMPVQCLGCGDVITILPSRQFPEYCEPCSLRSGTTRCATLSLNLSRRQATTRRLKGNWQNCGHNKGEVLSTFKRPKTSGKKEPTKKSS